MLFTLADPTFQLETGELLSLDRLKREQPELLAEAARQLVKFRDDKNLEFLLAVQQSRTLEPREAEYLALLRKTTP